MAAAEVGDPRAPLEPGGHPVQGGDPLGQQVHEVARAEEALAAGEDVLVVLVPAVAGARAEGVLDLGERLERTEGELERTGEEDRSGRVGERERLLGGHRVRARGGVVLDVAAGGLSAQPLVDVARVGAGGGGERRGRRPGPRPGRGRARAAPPAARCRRRRWRRGRRRTRRRKPSARPCRWRAAAASGCRLVVLWSVVVMVVSLIRHPGWMLVPERVRGAGCAAIATALQPLGRTLGAGTRARDGRTGMRAREPDTHGYVDVDGVRLAWESFNDAADTTVLFVPIDTCVNSRAWKGQVAYLAQHFRVVTVDPPGNGRSGRELDPEAYGDLALVADTLAVMDHLGIERAVLVGICVSAWQALLTAALHPERVLGRGRGRPVGTRPHATVPRPAGGGAALRGGARRLLGLEGQQPPLPARALARVRRVLLRPDAARAALDQAARGHRRLHPRDHGRGDPRRERGTAVPRQADEAERLLRGISAPVLVVQGTADLCQPQGRSRSVVEWTGAEHLLLEGSGHLPMARHPVVVNRAIKALVDRAAGRPPPAPRPGPSRPTRPRVLYLSSPIGLGHVRRDLAVADAMREQRPDLEVRVAHPVAGRRVPRAARRGGPPGLAAAGQRVRPLRGRVAASTTCTPSTPCAAWTRCWSTTSWSSTTSSSASPSTCGWATRRGTSTTSSTSTPPSSGRRSSG